MKKGLFKKLFLCLALGMGFMTLASCQSTNMQDAKIEQSVLNIVTEQQSGKQVLQGMIVLKNNTIFDVKSWDVSWTYTTNVQTEPQTVTYAAEPGYVSHGQAIGLIINYDAPALPAGETFRNVTFSGGTPHDVANIWESYMGWWIAAIAIVSISTIVFAASLFGKHLTKEAINEAFRQHMATSFVVGAFALILCLFPLFFGAWFASIILVSGVLASIVLGGLLSLIAGATAKE